MFFNSDQINQLTEEYSKVENKYQELLMQYTALELKNQEAYEYAYHGFTRRIGTLKRCIDNVYTICPPDQSEKLSRDQCLDLGINLQSFVFNVFGCMENLAWIWTKEKQLKNEKGKPLSGPKVGFMSPEKNKIIRNSFSQDFQDYLSNLRKENKGDDDKWYDILEDFRHALAHRIPLYVPPYGITLENTEKSNALEAQMREAMKKGDFQKWNQLNEEQTNLGYFLPVMSHSFTENSKRMVFHSQVLADWNTIVEMSEKFLEELD
jgi:hypothetical protein